jgi:hypothetical protein
MVSGLRVRSIPSEYVRKFIRAKSRNGERKTKERTVNTGGETKTDRERQGENESEDEGENDEERVEEDRTPLSGRRERSGRRRR